MKQLIITLSVIALTAICFSNNEKPRSSHSEELVVTEIVPSSSSSEQAEYDIALLCPKCNSVMYAKFKKGYTSSTVAVCKKCYQRYNIRYNWPPDHKEPTIREIKPVL